MPPPSATEWSIDHRTDTRAFEALLMSARVRCDEGPDGRGSDGRGSVRLVPMVRLHDLRHTAGVTMNIYSHVTPTQLSRAAHPMEDALPGND